jgi:hypothetical protein
MSCMQLDRTRFLQIVSAMAAATTACATAPRAEPEPVIVPLQPQPPATSAPVATAPAPPPAPSETASVPVVEAPLPPQGVGGLWTYPYDAAAKPSTCAELKCTLGAPWQEAHGALMRQCRGLDAALRPEVFQRFMKCMRGKAGTQGTCDLSAVGTDPGDCLERWTETPAIDPATQAKCKPIVAACGGPKRSVHAGAGQLTMQTCQQMLSIAKPRSEAKMIHCVTEYCDDAPRLCYLAY